MTTPRTNRPHGPLAEPARRAAWHTYLTVTHELLPALDEQPVDHGSVDATIKTVASRIWIWAPAWGPPGAVLAAATFTAQRLYRDGNYAHLAWLLRVLAPRLFRLSSGRAQAARGRTV